MITARVQFEQVFFKFEEARQVVETLHAELPIPGEDAPALRFSGGWERHQGLDDWYVDINLDDESAQHHLENILGNLPHSQGITVNFTDAVAAW